MDASHDPQKVEFAVLESKGESEQEATW